MDDCDRCEGRAREDLLKMSVEEWLSLPDIEVVHILKLQEDKEVVSAAVRAHPYLIRHVQSRLQLDRDVALAALRGQTARASSCRSYSRLLASNATNMHVFPLLNKKLRGDREVAYEALKVGGCGQLRTLLSPEIRQDKDFALAVLRQQPISQAKKNSCQEGEGIKVKDVLEEEKENSEDEADDEKKKAVLSRDVVTELVLLWQDDKDVAIAAMECCPTAFQSLGEAFRDDREVVLMALIHQTQSDVKILGQNILSMADKRFRADRELVLQAARAEGAAVGLASLELKQDKDFTLAAMRMAPVGDSRECYDEADLSIRNSITLDSFHAAFLSPFAVEGEVAPVVTVSIDPEDDLQQPDDTAGPGSGDQVIRSCTATLLSGRSFKCKLLEGPKVRQRSVLVGRLAKVILEELSKRRINTQGSPPAERVRLLIEKDGVCVPVSPWESVSRRLNEYL